MLINKNGSVFASKLKRAAVQNILSETVEAVKIEQELRKFRKNGRTHDLLKFYALQKKLAQHCDRLDLVSPHETISSHLKQIGGERRAISSYSIAIIKWIQDMEPLVAQHTTQNPVNDLLTRIDKLYRQHEELSTIQSRMQGETASPQMGPPEEEGAMEELEEGEIRESPTLRVSPAELLEQVKQFHASWETAPRNSANTPADINGILTSELVKCVIEDEINSALNASLTMLLLTTVSHGETCIADMSKLLAKTWDAIQVINSHLVQADTPGGMDQLGVYCHASHIFPLS